MVAIGKQGHDGRRRWRVRTILAIFDCLLLAGCSRAPAIAIAGAVFPGWFFCLAGGVVLTVIVHVVCRKTVGVAWLQPLPVSYVGLFAIFSALIWLSFFHR